MQRFLKTLCLLVTTLTLASCGAINLAYNNASILVVSEFDDAFDLNDEQTERLETGLDNFFAWHRQQELPRYQKLLEESALAIRDGITAAELQAIYLDARAAAERAVAYLIDEVGDLAVTLTAEQIDHFDAYHRSNSAKYQDYLRMSLQQREIFREKRSLKRLQDWFGKFDEFQRARVADRLMALPDGRQHWIVFRERRHDALLAALRAAPERGLSTAEIKFILLDPDSPHARVFEPKRTAYSLAFSSFIEELSPDLSKAQLRHAAERLEYYAEIVQDLQEYD